MISLLPAYISYLMCTQGYGLTETNGITCTISSQEYADHRRSCGRPAAVVDVKVKNNKFVLLTYFRILYIEL